MISPNRFNVLASVGADDNPEPVESPSRVSKQRHVSAEQVMVFEKIKLDAADTRIELLTLVQDPSLDRKIVQGAREIAKAIQNEVNRAGMIKHFDSAKLDALAKRIQHLKGMSPIKLKSSPSTVNPLNKKGDAASEGEARIGATKKEGSAPILVLSSPEVSKDGPEIDHKDKDVASESDSGEEGSEFETGGSESEGDSEASPKPTEQGLPTPVSQSSPKEIQGIFNGEKEALPLAGSEPLPSQVVGPEEFMKVADVET
ncbi:hypothetical protein U1Q18_035590 [Sarracenia purpurea var. burkii]